MNKHHTFKTGLLISILLIFIVLCYGIYSRLFLTSKSNTKDSIDVALITDSSDIDDSSYNQCAYEGIKEYCDEENIAYAYYKPMDTSAESLLSSVDEAVKKGAELIICPDSALSETVYQAQDRYEDVYFILVDSEPANNDGSVTQTGENVTSLLFDDDESGFLAGYTSVLCGYTQLSAIFNSDSNSDMHYYYGFLQGANYAAKESGIAITIKSRDICSAGNEYVSKYAAKAFSKGTELLFTCNKKVCESANKKAEKYNGFIINAGADMTDLSCVLGSVTKDIGNAVYLELKSYYTGTFCGGTCTTFNTSNNGITFQKNDKILKDFPQEKYDKMYQGLADGSILMISDTTVTTEDLNLTNVTLKSATPTDN